MITQIDAVNILFIFLYTHWCVCVGVYEYVFTCLTILNKQQMGEEGKGKGSLHLLWRCQSSRGRPPITYDPARSPHTARSRGEFGHGHPTFPPRGEGGLVRCWRQYFIFKEQLETLINLRIFNVNS